MRLRRASSKIAFAIVLLLLLSSCKKLSDFGSLADSGNKASQQLANYYSQLQDTTDRTLELSYFLSGLRGISDDATYQRLLTRKAEIRKRQAFATKIAAMYTAYSSLTSTKDEAQIESSVTDISTSLKSMKALSSSNTAFDSTASALAKQLDELVREKKAEKILPKLQAFNDGVVKLLQSEATDYQTFNDDYVDELKNVGQTLIDAGSADPEPLLDQELQTLGLAPIKDKPLTADAKAGYKNLLQFKAVQIDSSMNNAFTGIVGAFSKLSQACANLQKDQPLSLSSIEDSIQQAETYLGIVSDLKGKGASNGK
jgi:hypothetical protein